MGRRSDAVQGELDDERRLSGAGVAAGPVVLVKGEGDAGDGASDVLGSVAELSGPDVPTQPAEQELSVAGDTRAGVVQDAPVRPRGCLGEEVEHGLAVLREPVLRAQECLQPGRQRASILSLTNPYGSVLMPCDFPI